MSATAFDIRQPAIVAHELGEANARLGREHETPASVVELVEAVADAIADGDDAEAAPDQPLALDPAAERSHPRAGGTARR